jgi:dolichol-phosphate mannosyltransferase
MADEKILVMLPTYNECDNVRKMCDALTRLAIPMEILFIDDNSPDGTGDILDELATTVSRVLVHHRPGKLGIGSAHKEGIAWAYARGYTHLVTLDCDFTHPPENIPVLLKYADDYDVVVGSRHMRDDSLAGWNFWRKCVTKTAHTLTTILLKMPYDATGAFRLYRLDHIPPELFRDVESNGYSFFIESLAILNLNGFRIREIPIALPPRALGHSKLRFSDMVHWLTFMLGIAWTIRFNRKKYQVYRANNKPG